MSVVSHNFSQELEKNLEAKLKEKISLLIVYYSCKESSYSFAFQ
jgi:hypothetical protein